MARKRKTRKRFTSKKVKASAVRIYAVVREVLIVGFLFTGICYFTEAGKLANMLGQVLINMNQMV